MLVVMWKAFSMKGRNPRTTNPAANQDRFKMDEERLGTAYLRNQQHEGFPCRNLLVSHSSPCSSGLHYYATTKTGNLRVLNHGNRLVIGRSRDPLIQEPWRFGQIGPSGRPLLLSSRSPDSRIRRSTDYSRSDCGHPGSQFVTRKSQFRNFPLALPLWLTSFHLIS